MTSSNDDWYWEIGAWAGIICAAITFVGSWIYCAATYGFLLGFGLGWLPSAILAVMVGYAAKLLWAPAAALVGYLIVMAINHA